MTYLQPVTLAAGMTVTVAAWRLADMAGHAADLQSVVHALSASLRGEVPPLARSSTFPVLARLVRLSLTRPEDAALVQACDVPSLLLAMWELNGLRDLAQQMAAAASPAKGESEGRPPTLTLTQQALEYLTWEEVQATPPRVLAERLDALSRRRKRDRADNLMDIAMSNEINYGQELKGRIPTSTLPYKVLNTPFQRWHRALERAGLGLPYEELPEERLVRLAAENKRLHRALLA
ncbi:hypothetical protein [Deinococcus sp. QL22]|uniref:hypothetical protein n=1 Tax=Deinococcus sp. QL22 TaxID=2939437 RepID=UPI0020170FBB|nr:hypothetical protein [Deinococcus sp. QL22]UQN05462.1 hypothetical protein M1R55_11310 [Deinococcus sp. QL22]